MPDPFSVAASSFAVVGLADVVSRAGKEIYQFVNEIKGAPQEVESLRCSIHDTNLLVQDVKCYGEELTQSASLTTSAPPPPSQVLLQIKSALRALERELSALVTTIKRYPRLNNSWSWERIKWVLDERKILKSLQKLEAAKSILVAGLVLVGRRQDIRRQEAIEHDMQEGFQKMTSKIDGKLQTLEQRMQEVGANFSAGQTSLEVAAFGYRKQVAGLQKDFVTTNRNSVKQHEKTRDQVNQGNTKVIDSICSKLNDLPGQLAQTYTSSTKSSREVRFYGQLQHSMLCSLLLLKPGLSQAIFRILSEHSELVQAQHLYWLQSEFENLVSSATQEVAAISELSTAKSIDKWIYPRGVGSSFSPKDGYRCTGISNRRSRHEFRLSNETAESEEIKQRKRRKLPCQSFSFTLPVGKLEIMVPRPAGVLANASHSCNVVEVGFSFSPQPGICSTLINGHFMEAVNIGREPRLYAQLNAFILCEDAVSHLSLFYDGTLEEIDTAFRVGAMSPYVIDDDGNNIFLLAAYWGRLELFQYFDSQGIGPANLRGERSALLGLWLWLTDTTTPVDADKLFRVLTYLDEVDLVSTALHRPSLLNYRIPNLGPSCPDECISSWRQYISFLKKGEYDFENKDVEGNTALLDQLLWMTCQSFEIARLLLEFGANVHACTKWGGNAFQCAMLSARNEEDREILEQKLCLLIKAGAEINHLDHYGSTPSSCARYFGCLDEWCRALKSNDFNIDDVTQADIERFGVS